jgi:hypothetical protein
MTPEHTSSTRTAVLAAARGSRARMVAGISTQG